jgi:hypothetical protein
MKQLGKCHICFGEDFKLTEIKDNFGDIIKLKICSDCGVISERD